MTTRTLFQTLSQERRLQQYERFCRAFETAARELAAREGPPRLATCTIGRRQFIRWTQGEVKGLPRTETRRILEHMFQVPVERLFLVSTMRALTDGAPHSASRSARCDVTEYAGADVEEVAMAAAQESAHFTARAERSNIGPHTLEQIDADIRRIVSTYPNRPVLPLLLEVKGLRDRAFELLEGRQPPEYTKDLYLAAGVLCGVLANASLDLGCFAAAETQARAAFLCGELAGHNGLRAWIRGLQALIAYGDARPQDAIHLAEAGRSYVPERGTAHIRLASIEARAYGNLNDTRAALAALADATRLREELTDDTDIPGGMMSFPLAKQAFYASTTHLWLGGDQHLGEAETQAEKAIQLFEMAEPAKRRLGELSLARMDLALARLGRDDLDGSAEQVHAVLAMASRRPTDSVGRRLEQYARRLSLHPAAPTPTALHLVDAVHAYRSRTALPPGADQ